MNKKNFVAKKIVIFFSSTVGTLLLFEIFFQLNSHYSWVLLPVHTITPSSFFSQKDEALQKRSIEALRQGPYSNWKHKINEFKIYDYTKRLKKVNDPAQMFKPLATTRWTLEYPGLKENIYVVTYSFDEFGFRKTISRSQQKLYKTLFVGCSFTFGEGLNDHETFPSQFANFNTATEVLNYGTPGYGPNDVLFELQNNSLRSNAKILKVKTVVYTALADHIERTTCSYRYCLQFIDYSPGRVLSPMYVLNNKNQIIQHGYFSDHFPWNQHWLKYLSKSALLRETSLLSLPPSFKDILLTVQVLNEIKRILVAKWGVEEFIVALYPQQWPADLAYQFKISLEKQGITVFDFSQINAESDFYDLNLKMDGHPSPAGAYLYAWLLNESLSKRDSH